MKPEYFEDAGESPAPESGLLDLQDVMLCDDCKSRLAAKFNKMYREFYKDGFFKFVGERGKTGDDNG